MTDIFYDEIKNELLQDILPFWEKYSRDNTPGEEGFFARIDNQNKQDGKLSRTIVMTSRYLWTYSAAARLTKNPDYLKMADFAYAQIINKYWDKKNGGVYWSVTSDGKPDVCKKQIYGEAFCCYGLSEYAAALKELRENSETSDPVSQEAMDYALDLFNLIEEFALDSKDGGYVEARAKNWKKTRDMILSKKDMNCPKSMNTNLHVLEAYTNLYRTIPVVYGAFNKTQAEGVEDADRLSPFQLLGGSIQAEVGEALVKQIRIMVDKVLQQNTHLAMFFNYKWQSLKKEISFGHDIEASWLLWEAATELKDKELQEALKPVVLKIAEVTLEEGIDKESGALENFVLGDGRRDRTRVWWNQAEGLNGFYNAWEITGEEKYKVACQKLWDWIKNYQIDKEKGDWWNEVEPDGTVRLSEDKGGNWKTSYHSGRACMEILKRARKF